MHAIGNRIIEKDNKFCIKIQTENFDVAKKCFTLLKKGFNIEAEIVIRRNRYLKKSNVYLITVFSHEDSIRLLKAMRFLKADGTVFFAPFTAVGEKVKFRAVDQNGEPLAGVRFVFHDQRFIYPTNADGETWYWQDPVKYNYVDVQFKDEKGNDKDKRFWCTITEQQLEDANTTFIFKVDTAAA